MVPDSAIGVDGRTVRCAKCRHSWFQEGPDPLELGAPPAPAAPSAPPAPPTEPPPPPPPPVAAEEPPAAPAVHQDAAADEPASQDRGWQAEPDEPAYPDEPPISAPLPSEPVHEESYVYGDGYREPSPFDHSPPFRPRRNIPRLLTIAASMFAVVVLGIAALVWQFGLPNWFPVGTMKFAEAQPDLVLNFPENRQDRRTLPNGTEFFGASGTVTNVGDQERSVPSILIVMRDARERVVYSWEVVPPQRRLGPGESMTINEAVTDVPKSAKSADIGWKPG